MVTNFTSWIKTQLKNSCLLVSISIAHETLLNLFGPKPWIGLPRSQVLGEKVSLLPVGHTQCMPSSISQLVHLEHLLTNPKTTFSYHWCAKLMTSNESCHAIKGVCISELLNQPSLMGQEILCTMTPMQGASKEILKD